MGGRAGGREGGREKEGEAAKEGIACGLVIDNKRESEEEEAPA